MNSMEDITMDVENIFDDILTIQNIITLIIILCVVIYISVEYRDLWNPPMNSKGTPKYVKMRNRIPTCSRGRPVIVKDEMIKSGLSYEIDEFHYFLKRLRGYVQNNDGRVDITRANGRLLTWSYRPFREGEWWEYISSGLRTPNLPYHYGEPSIVPNPNLNTIESPLTLVSSEEDILRCLKGPMTVRIFPRHQPTFPKFKLTEHGDYVCDSTMHRLKGEEFTVEEGTLLCIPRGWAYRIRLDKSCIGVIRIPVYGLVSGIKRRIDYFKGRISSNMKKTFSKKKFQEEDDNVSVASSSVAESNDSELSCNSIDD